MQLNSSYSSGSDSTTKLIASTMALCDQPLPTRALKPATAAPAPILKSSMSYSNASTYGVPAPAASLSATAPRQPLANLPVLNPFDYARFESFIPSQVFCACSAALSCVPR
jgi:hypothetical protein